MRATQAIDAIVTAENERTKAVVAVRRYVESLQTAYDEGEGERLGILSALDLAKGCLEELQDISVQTDLDEALARQESEELDAPMLGYAA